MRQRGRRIQLDSRFEKNPPNTVRVTRPSRFSNPFRLKKHGGIYSLSESLLKYTSWLINKIKENPDFLLPLVGKNLACYCSLDDDCHIDFLLVNLEQYEFLFH